MAKSCFPKIPPNFKSKGNILLTGMGCKQPESKEGASDTPVRTGMLKGVHLEIFGGCKDGAYPPVPRLFHENEAPLTLLYVRECRTDIFVFSGIFFPYRLL